MRATLPGRGPAVESGAILKKLWWMILGAGAALLCAASPALAAQGGAGPSEAIFLAQMVVLILCGRLLGEGMQRLGQPAVMGPLIAGILLGPSAFGALWPDAQHALFPAIH